MIQTRRTRQARPIENDTSSFPSETRRVGLASRLTCNVSAANSSMKGSRASGGRSANVTRRCWNLGKTDSARRAALWTLRAYRGSAKPTDAATISATNRTTRALDMLQAENAKALTATTRIRVAVSATE